MMSADRSAPPGYIKHEMRKIMEECNHELFVAASVDNNLIKYFQKIVRWYLRSRSHLTSLLVGRLMSTWFIASSRAENLALASKAQSHFPMCRHQMKEQNDNNRLNKRQSVHAITMIGEWIPPHSNCSVLRPGSVDGSRANEMGNWHAQIPKCARTRANMHTVYATGNSIVSNGELLNFHTVCMYAKTRWTLARISHW